MEKISKYLNMPVICSADHYVAGVVKKIYFFEEEKRITGFCVKKRNTFINKLLRFEDVMHFGDEGLMIKDLSCFLRKQDANGISNETLSALKVYAYNGDFIGNIKDVFVDMETGKIDAIEVSSGYYDDIVTGTKRIPVFMKTEISEELIVMDKESMDEIKIGHGDF